MATFTDAKGREWEVKLSVGLLRRIKTETAIDLSYAMTNPNGLWQVMSASPVDLASALWMAVNGKGDEAARAEFEDGLDGEAMQKVVECLLSATADLFPRTEIGKKLKENIGKSLAELDRKVIEELEKPEQPS